MIKITYDTLRNPTFVGTMIRLQNHQKFPFRTCYWLTRLVNKLQAEERIANPLWSKLVEKHAERDAEGKIVRDEKGMVKIANPEEMGREADEYLATEIELDMPKVSPADLEAGDFRMSAQELKVLAPVVELED